SQSLGVYLYHTDDAGGWNSDWYDSLLWSEGQRGAEVLGRDPPECSLSGTALEYVFADFQAAGAERGEHKYGIDRQESARSKAFHTSQSGPGSGSGRWRRRFPVPGFL